jgi:hypothetical protein
MSRTPKSKAFSSPQCLSVLHTEIRAGTEVRPYLANNDYSMQVIGHNPHHTQFNAWAMNRYFVPRIVNHPASIV